MLKNSQAIRRISSIIWILVGWTLAFDIGAIVAYLAGAIIGAIPMVLGAAILENADEGIFLIFAIPLIAVGIGIVLASGPAGGGLFAGLITSLILLDENAIHRMRSVLWITLGWGFGWGASLGIAPLAALFGSTIMIREIREHHTDHFPGTGVS